MKPTYRAILIDLFWTTVDVDFSKFPIVKWAPVTPGKRGTSDGLAEIDQEIPSSGELLLQEIRQEVSGLGRDHFFEVFFSTRRRIRRMWDAGIEEETSSTQKFLDLLQELGVSKSLSLENRNRLAERLTEIHMRCILDSTTTTPQRKSLLEDLTDRYQLALVSNFDHAPTGLKILKKHGIERLFEAVIISDDLGKRKPHAILFESAMEALQVEPGECLMVGDCPLGDVQGASQMGMDTAWIQRPGRVWPENLNPPNFSLQDLSQLAQILKRTG